MDRVSILGMKGKKNVKSSLLSSFPMQVVSPFLASDLEDVGGRRRLRMFNHGLRPRLLTTAFKAQIITTYSGYYSTGARKRNKTNPIIQEAAWMMLNPDHFG